jgi:hypothetical protein
MLNNLALNYDFTAFYTIFCLSFPSHQKKTNRTVLQDYDSFYDFEIEFSSFLLNFLLKFNFCFFEKITKKHLSISGI